MVGLKSLERKQRKEFRRRNHIARDLGDPKYAQKVKPVKKHHLIDELHEKECQEELFEFYKDIGLASKE